MTAIDESFVKKETPMMVVGVAKHSGDILMIREYWYKRYTDYNHWHWCHVDANGQSRLKKDAVIVFKNLFTMEQARKKFGRK